MTNNVIRNVVDEMLSDWNAMTPAQQQRASLIANIAASETELRHRERAASHLTGIPKLQNESSISGLYDALNHLHIALIELQS